MMRRFTWSNDDLAAYEVAIKEKMIDTELAWRRWAIQVGPDLEQGRRN
jgi:hypothetical protein